MTVVPAQAGTQNHRPEIMGPRKRVPATRASQGAPRGGDSMIDRIAYDHRTTPPHAVVGIFIVKNSRETMVARFCNRRSASSAAGKRGRSLRAQQKTRRGIPPGRLGAVSVNTLFWKILVTRVKRKVSDFDCGGFVAFVTGGETETPVSQQFPGIARSALVAPSA